MVKSPGQTEGARRLLVGSVVLLALFAVLPLSITGWTSFFAALPRALVIPASAPLTKLSSWIRSPAQHHEELPNNADVEKVINEQGTLIAQLRAENERLRKALEATNTIVTSSKSAENVRRVVAPVVGSFSLSPTSIIRVKAGANEGVTKGSVAIGDLSQVVGIVTDVDARTCTVQLLTSKETKNFKAAIMVTESEILECVLAPTSGGLLKGDIEWPSDPAKRERLVPQTGQYVRMETGGIWPRSANRFVVGIVESIEQSTSPTGVGRKAVVVRPTIDPLSRVGEVILLLEASPDAPKAGTP
jgi:hypothetical protein